MHPSRINSQAVHLRISSPEVRQKRRKQVIPLRYRGLDVDRGRRRHISPRPVRNVSKFQPVESRLEGGLSIGGHEEQALQRLKDVDRRVRLPPKEPSLTVRGK